MSLTRCLISEPFEVRLGFELAAAAGQGTAPIHLVCPVK
jgi:hypothetical protein